MRDDLPPKWEPLAKTLVRKLEREDVGMHTPELMEYLELSNDRDLRTVVQYAIRELRVPIVSTFDDGYRIATGWSDDLYQHAMAQRRDVARANHEAVAAINAAMTERYGPPRLFEVAGG